MTKKRQKLSLSEQNALWQQKALPSLSPDELHDLTGDPDRLPEHFARFLDWFKRNPHKTPDEMYCFIMYDIEHNKVRRLVAKYLEKQGCIRVQKSVFFARMTRKMHREVLDILRKAQNCYENQDTILVLPVGEDMLNALTCIGKHFELELITSPKHTLIF
jgi:CRISPR-associated protein Cas2